ncbi:hypothetical protein ACHHYP_16595 [Achlya hypogyna]|uniref:Uncharacterized protein n=1 Tax=Achlya hypogyna TaxID=1202772 RepID=A0A1V9Y692_ACHHY|nr:hypothetical protein ACHHYP_16595 [Achlya hypogyna]
MSTKKTTPLRSTVLVSPISVAHRNRSMDADGVNPVRAQWVANLKKRADASSSPSPDVVSASTPPYGCKDSMKMYGGGHIEYSGRATHQSVRVEPKTSAQVEMFPKKLIKPLLKKRPNCPTVLELASGKPRTPRRKISGGHEFDEMQIQTTLDGCYPSVGTPSAHHHHRGPTSPGMIDPLYGIDFCSFDTFLDLPTPKSLQEMPTFPVIESLDAPALVRATSVEQEGLSLCFEHTHLSRPLPSPFSSSLRPPTGCVFDHSKHPELENIFDFDDSDIDKEVDSFYYDGDDHDIDLM